MPEIRIETRRFAKPQGIVGGTLAVPARFVMEKAEKAVRLRTNIQSERPNAAAGPDAFGIRDSVKGLIRMPHAKIKGNGIRLLHVR